MAGQGAVTGLPVSLKADCGHCAALCCVAFAFEVSDMFPVDKPADRPCTHLQPDFRCAIHDDRAEMGFRGCVRFDCRGAGQRVTQGLFAGRDWRNEPALAPRMFEAFRSMNRVHECLELVTLLSGLPLDEGARATCAGFMDLLEPDAGWTEERLQAFPYEKTRKEILAFAAGLKGSAAAAALARKA